ncbi:MAG: epoxyqueuosine reductase QueH, partial [Lachnospiraceae bacterium]|nr:epoxyqueuosine reductase QueH [Candidatus Equihabitans merdae]
MKINYQKELEKIIKMHQERGETPRLFLHSCCAPCSSYVLEYLSEYFSITDYYYNPNITERSEFDKRSQELRRLIEEMPLKNPVTYVEGAFE